MSNLNPGGLTRVLNYLKTWVTGLLNDKANSSHTHTKSQITDFPTIPSNTSQLTNDSGYITSSGSCNYANSAGYVQGNNNSANAANALLRSGSGRTDSSPEGDTWIFLDELGGSSAPWGFKHNQAANTIGFYGAGTETSSINLSNGYFSGSCNYANSAGNSDTLDGYHEYSFLRNRGSTSTSGEGTLWAQIGIKEYYNALPDGLNDVYNYGEVVSLAGTSCRFDIYCSHHSSNGGGLYYRSGWNDDKKAWRCFIDSANIGSQSVNYANSAGSANDPNAVHKSGDETIDGVKTYSSDIYSVSSQHLRFRHLDGSNNGGMDGCLFLNYDNNAKNVYFNGASYYINGGYYNGTAERSNSSGYADSAGSCNYANSAGSASSTSSVSFSNNGQCSISAGGADCGDAIDSQACNLAIRSWWSIGFYDQCFNKYAISMDVRNGIVRAYTLRAENSSDKGLQLGSYHVYVG